jgi:arabinogalactan oligomer/maltooligosaccharide transport system substrate-binding protein
MRRIGVTTAASITAAIASVAILAGCAAGPPDAAVQGLLGQTGGGLTMWAGEDQIPGLQNAIAQYEEDTGIGIELVQRNANEQMISEYLTQVPTGQGPDIIGAPHDVLGQLVANGAVAPIELGERTEDFLDVAIAALTYGGVVYGVPYGIENVVLLRNNDLVSETPATFDELIAQGQELVDAGTAQYPVLINQSPEAGDPYHVYPIQTSFGAEVFARNDDGYTSELTMGGAEGQRFAEYLQKLGELGVLNTALTADIAKEAFINGESPYIISGPWNVADIRAAGVNISALPVPSAGGGQSRPFVGVQAFYVNPQSGNTLPAQDFLTNYLTTPEAQLALFESAGRPPALREAVDQIQDDEVLSSFAEISESGLPMPAIPEMGSVWSYWGTTENGIVDGQGTPDELWNRMIENIEREIE